MGEWKNEKHNHFLFNPFWYKLWCTKTLDIKRGVYTIRILEWIHRWYECGNRTQHLVSTRIWWFQTSKNVSMTSWYDCSIRRTHYVFLYCIQSCIRTNYYNNKFTLTNISIWYGWVIIMSTFLDTTTILESITFWLIVIGVVTWNTSLPFWMWYLIWWLCSCLSNWCPDLMPWRWYHRCRLFR